MKQRLTCPAHVMFDSSETDGDDSRLSMSSENQKKGSLQRYICGYVLDFDLSRYSPALNADCSRIIIRSRWIRDIIEQSDSCEIITFVDSVGRCIDASVVWEKIDDA